MQLLTSPLAAAFDAFADRIETNGLICSPFVSSKAARRLVSTLERNGIASHVSLGVVTDLSVRNLVQESTDIGALIELTERVPNTVITYLPRVHAKVFTADDNMALIGSFNWTMGGMARNFEYGVCIEEPSTVREICRDIRSYADLGGRMDPRELQRLSRRVSTLRDSIREAQETITKEYRATVEELQKQVETGLLRVRIKDRSQQAVFADTIRYLLGQEPLTTGQIYERIQAIHPDLCDDAAIRIISGDPRVVWQHRVRHAQQALRAQGVIDRDAETGRWKTAADRGSEGMAQRHRP